MYNIKAITKNGAPQCITCDSNDFAFYLNLRSFLNLVPSGQFKRKFLDH